MIYYASGTDLFLHPLLATSMFRARKKQFFDRHGWPVSFDKNQLERDQYDHMNPIYVMIKSDRGTHAGSMRLMPTTGPTMINEYFVKSLGGSPIKDANYWECTRFCISRDASRQTAIALFAAAGFLMKRLKVDNLVAVFDAPMKRIYHINGVSPEVLGQQDSNEGRIFAGKWKFCDDLLRQLTLKSGFSADIFELGLANTSVFENRASLAA